jgi:peptide/nickel transport system ATP-binding protein
MNLLKINDLKCHYLTDINTVKAVDGISFEIEEGDILGIVGESGSGKTTVALGIMGLLPENTAVSGEIRYKDEVISSLPESGMDRFRWKDIAIVFQNSLEILKKPGVNALTCSGQWALILSGWIHIRISSPEV